MPYFQSLSSDLFFFTTDYRVPYGYKYETAQSTFMIYFLFLSFFADPSVTVELTHKNEIIQQIPVKPKRKSLTLEAEFSFEVATNTSFTLENFGVQFNVNHHDFIRGNELVGQVRLAMDAPLPSEVKHWTAVVLSPHKPIEEWHKLHAPLQPD